MKKHYIIIFVLGLISCGQETKKYDGLISNKEAMLFHIPSTGQSNSIGGGGDVALTLSPFAKNLKMNADNTRWLPLTEPVTGHEWRGQTETHAAMMAQTISQNLGWEIIVSNSGEGGHSMRWIEKDGIGQSYAHSIQAVKQSTYLAMLIGRPLIVPCIVLIHGESDAIEGTQDYSSRLIKLQQDYDKDIRAITGQTQPVILFVTLFGGDQGGIWKAKIHDDIRSAAIDLPYIIIAGSDEDAEWQGIPHIHHTNIGYQQIGKIIGDAIVNHFKIEPF